MKYISAKSVAGNLAISLFLAFKSIIKGNRWVPILLVLVMSFSFVNLIFTSSLITGVMHTMDEQLINAVFSNIIISPPENEYYIDHVSQLEAKAEQVHGVSCVSPHLNNSAFFEYRWEEKESQMDRGKSGTWEVIGINPEKEAGVTIVHDQIIAGSYLEESDRDKIVLGIEIAGGEAAQNEQFLTLGGVNIGDKVRLSYPNGIQREYTVKGIFRTREKARADNLAFVTLREMASVLGRGTFYDRASEVLVKTTPDVEEGEVIRELKAMAIQGEIRSWHEYGGAMRDTIATFEIIGSLINGVGLIVAGIVMFIVIYINVISKKRQIGIMRAIGIAQGTIIASYLFQALFYATFGVLFGWLIVRFLLLPYFISNPIDLPIGLVSLTVQPLTMGASTVGLILAAILAGLIPAWAMMKQSIIKAIWGS
jgi:putative ABC transport system permease protein